jgi:hypothetical protein
MGNDSQRLVGRLVLVASPVLLAASVVGVNLVVAFPL